MKRVNGRRLLHAADTVAGACGLLRLWRRASRDALIVLMYHRILPEDQAASYPLANLVVTVAALREQAAWLAGHCRVMPLAEAIATPRGAADSGGRPLVCLTFDDGYADNAIHAAPILAEYGCPATFFVTTGFVSGEPLWFDVVGRAWQRCGSRPLAKAAGQAHLPTALDGQLGWLKRQPTARREQIVTALRDSLGEDAQDPMDAAMTPQQLATLTEAGHEIAAHTVTHPILTRCSDAQLARELAEPRETIQRWTGRAVVGMSYPNGDVDDRVATAAAAAGYTYACTIRRGANGPDQPPLRLRRRMISPDNATLAGRPSRVMFAAETLGWHEMLRRVTSTAVA